MKWNCELIQDLLPLYEEGLCSETSREAVCEHLAECEICRRLAAPLPIEEPADSPAADQAVAKSMKKVKRRYLTSLIAAVLAVPLLLMSVNQFRGQGLCFTNLDDAFTAWRFLHALEAGDWEKAAAMHDYSNAYESILEALAVPLADTGIPFVPCDLAGYDYMAHSFLERDGILPETVEDLYGYLYNRQGTAMVPVALWEQLMTLDPDAVVHREGWQYWLGENLYGRITTPWGDFVVSEGQGYDTAYEYCVYFDLVPAALYEEAIPALQEEALRVYTSTHESVGWVAELTEGEFIDHMERAYAADLQALADTVSFECTGFRSAYQVWSDDGWNISFGVTIIYEGQPLDTEIDICVQNGKVRVAGISHKPGIQWQDEIDQALYPSAYPGY